MQSGSKCGNGRVVPWTRTFALVIPAVAILAGRALAQSDNFNDGNDVGWQRYDPFAPFGANATFSFPGGGYRIQSAASPNPPALGPSRAASLLSGALNSDFRVSCDLLEWDTDHRLNFGVVARINTLGLGTTTGYALTYSPDIGDLTISRITNEAATILIDGPLASNSAAQFRLAFEGEGDSLTGRIFDLTDLSTPLAEINVTDSTYISGIAGLLVFDSTSVATGTFASAATFDNFNLEPLPEPSGTLMLLPALLALRGRQRRSSR